MMNDDWPDPEAPLRGADGEPDWAVHDQAVRARLERAIKEALREASIRATNQSGDPDRVAHWALAYIANFLAEGCYVDTDDEPT